MWFLYHKANEHTTIVKLGWWIFSAAHISPLVELAGHSLVSTFETEMDGDPNPVVVPARDIFYLKIIQAHDVFPSEPLVPRREVESYYICASRPTDLGNPNPSHRCPRLNHRRTHTQPARPSPQVRLASASPFGRGPSWLPRILTSALSGTRNGGQLRDSQVSASPVALG